MLRGICEERPRVRRRFGNRSSAVFANSFITSSESGSGISAATRRRHRLPGDMAVDPFHRIGGFERQRTGQHLVESDTHGVKVTPGIDRPVHAARLLRCHVGECSGNYLRWFWSLAFSRKREAIPKPVTRLCPPSSTRIFAGLSPCGSDLAGGVCPTPWRARWPIEETGLTPSVVPEAELSGCPPGSSRISIGRPSRRTRTRGRTAQSESTSSRREYSCSSRATIQAPVVPKREPAPAPMPPSAGVDRDRMKSPPSQSDLRNLVP